jgi:hypothetical protein
VNEEDRIGMERKRREKDEGGGGCARQVILLLLVFSPSLQLSRPVLSCPVPSLQEQKHPFRTLH